jgi:hypothetical protein
MLQDGGYYERVGAVVTVTEKGEVRTPGLYALKQRLERFIRFDKFDGRAKEVKPADCPDEIARRMLDSKGETPFPPLGGIVLYTPVLVRHGSVHGPPDFRRLNAVADPGRILFGSEWPYAPEAMTRDSIKSLGAPGFLSQAQRAAVDRGNALQFFPRLA